MAAKVTATEIRQASRAAADDDTARRTARFFKCGEGEYGEGDRFHGVRMPVLRSMVKKYRSASQKTVVSLLKSNWHEERMLAILLLVEHYKGGTESEKKSTFDTYMSHRRFVNNWDLVDSSAHLIVGPQLDAGSRRILAELAVSDSLWDRRIAMMATYHFIRRHEFSETLKIAKILRDDKHDLIHKVVGWMLREVGNRDRSVEEAFLERHHRKMPRTMLRYAIEKFPEARRKAYLNGTV